MIRPDQERFDRFALQVTVLDDALGCFCESNGFEMEANAYRTPSRVLRRQRESMEIIDIYLDGDWKVIDYRECLPCRFDVCSYYEIPSDKCKMRKISKVIFNGDSFLSMASKIDELLRTSLDVFDEWVPEVVVSAGEEIENTKRMYEDGKLSY
ncbi:MAG: hypothetical protein JNN30_15225 [Rhodanobacteraceae bacterium]|nr:hypothetical protein [Rhodanobacteraceae bacterium]